MPSPFISDGYTRWATLAAGEMHPALLFEYRPMLAVDRCQLVDRMKRLAGDRHDGIAAVERIVVQELSHRLVSWTLVDDDGVPVPISDDTLLRADSTILAGLAAIILGLAAGDAEREAADEKNCGAGCGCSSPLPASPRATAAIVNCTSTTNRPAAASCMRASRSCGRPARIPRAGCRTSVVPKEHPKIRTRSAVKTNRPTGSTASPGPWDSSLMILWSAGTRC